MKVFILDDEEIRLSTFFKALMGGGHSITITRTVAEALKRFGKDDETYDLILLNHDLGGSNQTGYDFIVLMPQCTKGGPWPLAVVHAFDADPARRMVKLLHDKNYAATWHPFGRSLIDQIESMSKEKAVRH